MRKNILILSPHPDDACFSLGGSMMKYVAKYNIFIYDIFSDKDYNIIKSDNESCIKELILNEELEVAEKLGINVTFANLKDAKARGYKRLSDIFGRAINIEQLLEKESNIFQTASEAVREFVNSIEFKWVGIPIGSGFHVDHILTREIGLKLFNSFVQNKKMNLFFYEDLPYSLNKNWLNEAINHCRTNLKLKRLHVSIDDYIDKKKELIMLYQSQIKERDADQITNYAKTLDSCGFYERIWLVSNKGGI